MERNPLGSGREGDCTSRLPFRGREAMAHSTQQGFFVSMSTRGYSRSARAAEEGVALGQEALQAMLEHRPVDLRKDVGNDRPGDARRRGCGGANREGPRTTRGRASGVILAQAL